MEYLLLIHEDPSTPEYAEPEPDVFDWAAEATRRGVRVRGNRLRPPQNATIVSSRGGEVLVADGPFAETREIITGYDVFEASSLDEAVELASRHPGARTGFIELRPAWGFDEEV